MRFIKGYSQYDHDKAINILQEVLEGEELEFEIENSNKPNFHLTDYDLIVKFPSENSFNKEFIDDFLLDFNNPHSVRCHPESVERMKLNSIMVKIKKLTGLELQFFTTGYSRVNNSIDRVLCLYISLRLPRI